jgi:hypothetical protein
MSQDYRCSTTQRFMSQCCRAAREAIGIAGTKASQKVLLLPCRPGDITGSRSKRGEVTIDWSGDRTAGPNIYHGEGRIGRNGPSFFVTVRYKSNVCDETLHTPLMKY